MTDKPTPASALITRAKADPAMIRDYGDGQRITDAQLGAALGYLGPSGRNTVARIAGGQPVPEQTRLLLLALLDGWRPAR